MKKRIYLFLSFTVGLILTGCMEKEDKPPYFVHVESVVIDTVRVLEIGQNKTARLPFTIYPLDAGNQKVTWYSRDETIATVSSGGLVTALKLGGRTRIGVQTSDMRKIDEIEIVVTKYVADIPMTGFSTGLTGHLFDVEGGNAEPLTLKPACEPENASDPYFKATSSDPWVVRVIPDDPEKPTSFLLAPLSYGKVTLTVEPMDGSELPAQEIILVVNATKDINYDVTGGINADGYYKILYKAINYQVGVDGDGNPIMQTWLDRNLGAKQVAAAVNDPAAYGSKFQWSRKADGHEQTAYTDNGGTISWDLVNGRTTPDAKAPSRGDAGTNQFIPVSAATWDWVAGTAEDPGLWGGIAGNYSGAAALDHESQANNPCPPGYRIPSPNEAIALIRAATGVELAFSGNTPCPTAAADLFEAIRLPSGGEISRGAAGAFNTDGRAFYWSNVPLSSGNGNRWGYVSGNVHSSNYSRCSGYAVRCIKDTPLATTDISLD